MLSYEENLSKEQRLVTNASSPARWLSSQIHLHLEPPAPLWNLREIPILDPVKALPTRVLRVSNHSVFVIWHIVLHFWHAWSSLPLTARSVVAFVTTFGQTYWHPAVYRTGNNFQFIWHWRRKRIDAASVVRFYSKWGRPIEANDARSCYLLKAIQQYCS